MHGPTPSSVFRSARRGRRPRVASRLSFSATSRLKAGFPVSFVESLGDVPQSSTAKLYLFMNGVEGPNPFGFQPNVIDSVPGDPEYSPLWLVHAVTWENESDARELRSEEEILEAEQNGELTVEPTELIKNSPVVP